VALLGWMTACVAGTEHVPTKAAPPLHEIEAGDDPDRIAGTVRETPAEPSLAGTLAEAREREAFERVASAERKRTAGDGKGCVAELDAYDRLAPQWRSKSTEPLEYGLMRAECLMLAGQCEAGRVLARRYLARIHPEHSAAHTESSVDSMVAGTCGPEADTPLDRLIVALSVLRQGAKNGQMTATACVSALDRGVAALPHTTPRDANDRLVIEAGWALATDGARCIARAGECITAWQRFPALFDVWVRSERIDGANDPDDVRAAFDHATEGECVGRYSGPLTPPEELAHAIEGLEWAKEHRSFPVTAEFCADLADHGVRALHSLRGDSSNFVKDGSMRLLIEGTRCFVRTEDCASARTFFVELSRERDPQNDLLGIEDAYISFERPNANACEKAFISRLTPDEQLIHAMAILSVTDECGSAFDALVNAVAAVLDPELRKQYQTELELRPFRCFAYAGQCVEAWNAYRITNQWQDNPRNDEHLRDDFTSLASGYCPTVMEPGLSPAEQYWAAIVHMRAGDVRSLAKCKALQRHAKRTASAVQVPPHGHEVDPDSAFAACKKRLRD